MLPYVASFQWLHIHTGHTKAAEKILAAPAVSTSRQLQPEIYGRQGFVSVIWIEISWETWFLSWYQLRTLEIESDPLSLIGHLAVCFVGMIRWDSAGGITQMQISWKMIDKFRLLEGSFPYQADKVKARQTSSRNQKLNSWEDDRVLHKRKA